MFMDKMPYWIEITDFLPFGIGARRYDRRTDAAFHETFASGNHHEAIEISDTSDLPSIFLHSYAVSTFALPLWALGRLLF